MNEYVPEAIGIAYFHGEDWYKCPNCGEQFEYYEAYYERCGFKRADEQRTYICPKCKKKFRIS